MVCKGAACRPLSNGAVRDIVVWVGGTGSSFGKACPCPRSSVAGVKGVLGVVMNRPEHFGQRVGISDGFAEPGDPPFVLPPLRGWYLYPGYCR